MSLAVKFRIQSPSWALGLFSVWHSFVALRILYRDLLLLHPGAGSCSWSLVELCCEYVCAQCHTFLMLILTQTCPITADIPDSLNSWHGLMITAGPTLNGLLGSCGTESLSLRVQLCLPFCNFGLPAPFSFQSNLPCLLLGIVFLFLDNYIYGAKPTKISH